jgi:dUTP pyrophosphatase
MLPLKKAFEFRVTSESLRPTYETEDSTGADLRAAQDVVILPNQTVKVPTGVFIEKSEPVISQAGDNDGDADVFADIQIRPKSGRSAAGVFAQYGTVDHGYRGEIQVVLFNSTGAVVRIPAGEKVAQLVVGAALRLPFEVKQVTRGEGGFGSTGAT